MGTGEGAFDDGPLVDINLAMTAGVADPREFVTPPEAPAFGPQTIIDLDGVQWDWVLSTWNPAFTVDPPWSPLYSLFRGITQRRNLFSPLANPLVPVAAAGINPEVVHYYAPRTYGPGVNIVAIHFLVRAAVAAGGLDVEAPGPPRSRQTEIPEEESPDMTPPAGGEPLGGAIAEIATGNVYWFWNAAQVANPGSPAESVAAVGPPGAIIAGPSQHLLLDTTNGPVTITPIDPLPSSLGGVSFERWMLFWPPGAPNFGNQGLSVIGNVATAPQGSNVELVAVYSDLTPTSVTLPTLSFPVIRQLVEATTSAELVGGIEGDINEFAINPDRLDDLIESLRALRDNLR
ncbi:MAG: hypothetical protein OEV40_24450 [Acidimicrobiia bacterium]|nr:hypothetical protein [Acidimicrobiia bacterium]